MKHLSCASIRVGGSWPHPQTLDEAGKACHGQTLDFIQKSVNYEHKKFYNFGLRCRSDKRFGIYLVILFAS
jgi:hypothetical protein